MAPQFFVTPSGTLTRSRMLAISVVLACVFALAGAMEAADTITELGTLPGGLRSFTGGMNAAGQVVGGSEIADSSLRAFLWNDQGGMQNLGSLGLDSYADGVNAAGQVVGRSTRLDFLEHAFLWDAVGGMQDLGTLTGGMLSQAHAINSAGQVVGESEMTTANGAVETHAFLWTSGGGMVDLGTLPGGSWSAAYAINGAGQVVGQANTASGAYHAFLWDASGGMRDLGTLPGGTTSVAFGINSAGQVVGRSTTAGGETRGFLWEPSNDVMTDLGTLPNGGSSFALDLNDAGQIVGGADAANGSRHAVIWEAGSIRDLGTLPGGDESVASSINGNSRAAGQASTASGLNMAVIWQLNRPPVADSQAVATAEGASVGITLTGSDPDGDALTFAIATGPANGSLSGTPPSLTYTPSPSFSGSDSFTFRVNDGIVDSAVATVSITVSPTAPPPPPPDPIPTPGPGPSDEEMLGQMNGHGELRAAEKRHHFEFKLRLSIDGRPHGWLRYRAQPIKTDGGQSRRHAAGERWVDRFVSTTIDSAIFSDDPSIRPGRGPEPTVDTARFSGSGRWNGVPGYSFEATAKDAGEPGAGRDSLTLTIKSPDGAVVATVNGVLVAGNIQSRRPRR